MQVATLLNNHIKAGKTHDALGQELDVSAPATYQYINGDSIMREDTVARILDCLGIKPEEYPHFVEIEGFGDSVEEYWPERHHIVHLLKNHQAAGKTMKDLAHQLDVSAPMVHHYINRTSKIQPSTVSRILSQLKITVDEFRHFLEIQGFGDNIIEPPSFKL